MNHWIAEYGMIGIAIILFLEMVGIPFPTETTLVFVGIGWAKQQFDPLFLFPVAILGHALGSTAGYGIGRLVGRLVITRFGKYVGITPEKLASAEQKFHKFQSAVIIIAKFIAVVRILIPFIAGINRMPFWRFTLINLLGSILWVSTFLMGGRFLGKIVIRYEHQVMRYLVPLLIVAVIVGIGVYIYKKRKRPLPSQSEENGRKEN